MTRFALRCTEAYPFPKYRGDVITLGNSSREQVEDIRAHMATGAWCEVVQLDDDGNVIEP